MLARIQTPWHLECWFIIFPRVSLVILLGNSFTFPGTSPAFSCFSTCTSAHIHSTRCSKRSGAASLTPRAVVDAGAGKIKRGKKNSFSFFVWFLLSKHETPDLPPTSKCFFVSFIVPLVFYKQIKGGRRNEESNRSSRHISCHKSCIINLGNTSLSLRE